MSKQKETEEKQRLRKEYAERGTRGQKMFNFRMDIENWNWLQSQSNKGRYLNNLIQQAREAEGTRQ